MTVQEKCSEIATMIGWKIASKPASSKHGSPELYKVWVKPSGETVPTWRNLKFDTDIDLQFEALYAIASLKYRYHISHNLIVLTEHGRGIAQVFVKIEVSPQEDVRTGIFNALFELSQKIKT